MLGPLSNASFLLPVEGLRRASHILGVDSSASGPSYTQLQFLTLQSRRPHMDSTLFIPSPHSSHACTVCDSFSFDRRLAQGWGQSPMDPRVSSGSRHRASCTTRVHTYCSYSKITQVVPFSLDTPHIHLLSLEGSRRKQKDSIASGRILNVRGTINP